MDSRLQIVASLGIVLLGALVALEPLLSIVGGHASLLVVAAVVLVLLGMGIAVASAAAAAGLTGRIASGPAVRSAIMFVGGGICLSSMPAASPHNMAYLPAGASILVTIVLVLGAVYAIALGSQQMRAALA
ncbi:hypothetical protein [Halococcoides cellulosivorans]|uniref:Uncharacterized protein n=1 Tax=Halococcoides cellulosivorans TaxID=1679096 RepID=A0A2R4WY61_9EURY|nr:hypothetical protein [Halococcoides cellulosivorans]AWB26461.1 hypothetical protein HARCEL1_01375 [Halococcoides cellulosivorans]